MCIRECQSEGDNCVWLESEKDGIRHYGYRFREGNDMAPINSGETYILQVSERIWNETSGNIGDARSSTSEVTVPQYVPAKVDFSLTVNYF